MCSAPLVVTYRCALSSERHSVASFIPSKQLIKSLELIALGETVIHPQLHQAAFAQMAVQSHPIREFEATSATPASNGYKAIAELPRHSEVQPPFGLLAADETPGTSNGGTARVRRPRTVAGELVIFVNAHRGRIK